MNSILVHIPRKSHHVYENDPKSEKNLNSETLLVPRISDKQWSTYTFYFELGGLGAIGYEAVDDQSKLHAHSYYCLHCRFADGL